MVVYVETNFVLELIRLQEQYVACQTLLKLACAGRIELVVPAYSLVEPFETLHRDGKQRDVLEKSLRQEIKQLSRSAPYRDMAAAHDLTAFFALSQVEEKGRTLALLQQLLTTGRLIELTAPLLGKALELQKTGTFIDAPQDSVVYASILSHLAQLPLDQPKVFLNRNSKDFDDPTLKDELREYNCQLILSFDNGLDYVESQLKAV